MRARDLGIVVGQHPTGPDNAITDVAGVRVGHVTLDEIGPPAVHTGVTVVVPHRDIWTEPVFAGAHRLNGSGELTGLEWIRESGELTTAIGLTNTHSVGVVRDALVEAQVQVRGDGHLLVAARRRRDLRRTAQRHQRTPRARRTCPRGAGVRVRRPGRRGQRRRRNGHDLPRVQGRHRHLLARHRHRDRAVHRRSSGAGQPRTPRAASGERRARRRADRTRPGAAARDARRATSRARVRSSSSSPPTHRCCRTSAPGSRSAPRWRSPGSAAPASSTAAT